jgi:hypothetical protein
MEWKEGNMAKARELYQRALSINSTSESAARCLQVIRCHVMHLEIEIDVVSIVFTYQKIKNTFAGLGCSRTENW